VVGLALRVAETATIPIGHEVRTDSIAIRFWGFMAFRPDQKLLSHLGEAGAAIFVVQHIEYGGHDRTSLFGHLNVHLPGLCGCELDHNPPR
jgi:hypothetical protein